MWQWAAGLLAGTCAMLSLPRTPPAVAVVAACATCIVAALILRRHWPWAIALGLALCALELDRRLAERLDPALEGHVLRLSGTVASVPQGTSAMQRFRFAPIAGEPGAPRVPRLIELTWYDSPSTVSAAESLDVEVRLRRPRGFANPGGYDYEARLLRDGVGATGYVRSAERHGVDPATARTHPVLRVRAAVSNVVHRALGKRPSAGIVAGLAVGLQDALSREQWRALARTGTSHLMAISGLHIAMVAALAAWAGRRWQRWRQGHGAQRPQRDIAVIAGAIVAAAYSLLAGWSVPTQRTMVMIAVGALALLQRRRTGIADGLGLCVVAVVLMNPLAPLAPGFWLSFGAVAAILYGATGHLQRPSTVAAYLQVQWVVTLGLLPVLVASFGSVSLVSAFVNLLAIPLYTLVVVPAVLFACAVALLWYDLGAVLLRATGSLIEATWPLFEVPAGWSFAAWPIASLEPVAWCALLVGTLAALSPLPRAGRAAGLALVAMACAWRPATVPMGAARVTVLDVGQGLSVVIETNAHTLVYDTGPAFRTGSDTGQLVVVPFLQSRGLVELDALVVSHDDSDHRGGATSVLEQVPTATVWTGPGVALAGLEPAHEHAVCRRGVRWQWDGVEFAFLHPGATPLATDNDASCVLHVRAGEHAVLLPGDVERAAEAEMLVRGDVTQATVVVVPHHGSRTSSTPELVEATRPRFVAYAVGHRNRWNFPKPEVVGRWQAVGAADLRTSASGAITFELSPGRPLSAPAQWRPGHPRPWRDP